MSRNVFLSMLGSTNYTECTYIEPSSGYKSAKVKFIQEAMLDKIARQWSQDDTIYIFVTSGKKGSKQKNWLNNGHGNNDTGLEERLDSMNLKAKVEAVEIPDGNNEDEIWEIFRCVYVSICENDNIYIDVTHGYRYLPMLSIVLLNYAKHLKNVNVKSISYGNFEGRNENNEANIINLMSFSLLQEWSNAANNFIRFGNAKALNKIIQNYQRSDPKYNGVAEFTECVKNIADSINTNRKIELISGENFRKLNALSNDLKKDLIPAYAPLIDKIQEKTQKFSPDINIMNGFHAVDWCIKNELVQQGITLLQESVLTYILYQINRDWKNKKYRNLLSSVMCVKEENFDKKRCENEDETKLVEDLYNFDIVKKFREVYKSLNVGSRNDINHAGMNMGTGTPKKIADQLKKKYEKISTIIQEIEDEKK